MLNGTGVHDCVPGFSMQRSQQWEAVGRKEKPRQGVLSKRSLGGWGDISLNINVKEPFRARRPPACYTCGYVNTASASPFMLALVIVLMLWISPHMNLLTLRYYANLISWQTAGISSMNPAKAVYCYYNGCFDCNVIQNACGVWHTQGCRLEI